MYTFFMTSVLNKTDIFGCMHLFTYIYNATSIYKIYVQSAKKINSTPQNINIQYNSETGAGKFF